MQKKKKILIPQEAVDQDFRNYRIINITKLKKHATVPNRKAQGSLAIKDDKIHAADSSTHSINAFMRQKKHIF